MENLAKVCMKSSSKSMEEAELGKGIIRGLGQIPQREYILV